MIIKFIKKITHKVLYNDLTHFYGSRYITYKNIKKSFFKKKQIYKKNDYIYFLFKKLYKFNIKERLLKKIFISIYTIIYELSADCSIKKIEICIENQVNKVNLKILHYIFHKTLPSGFNIKLKDINNSIIIFNKHKTSNGLHKIIITEKNISVKKDCNLFYNIIIDVKKKTIIDIRKKEINKNCFIVNDHLHYYKYYNQIKGALKEIKSYTKIPSLDYSEYKIKKEKTFLCKYKHISSFENFEISNIQKKYSNNKEYNRVLTIKNAIISYRGLISSNQFVIKESIGHSIWDPLFRTNKNKIIIPKITRKVDGNAIVFPTAHSSLGHYIFESIIRLCYLKKDINYKIIVYENLPDYLFRILLRIGLKRKQILVKNFYESWQIETLLFPIIPLFEVSKKETNFLGSLININDYNKLKYFNNQSYKKIYISRADSKENRNLINEKEIENFLKLNGYKIIIASKINILEKNIIFSNAEIIITPLGSAIHNFMFCNKIKAKILVIGTNKYFKRDYIQYAFLMKLKLYFLEATEIPSHTEAWHYNHSSFFLNQVTLEKSLKILEK